MAGEHILNGGLIYIKWASNIYYFGERIGSVNGYKKSAPPHHVVEHPTLLTNICIYTRTLILTLILLRQLRRLS